MAQALYKCNECKFTCATAADLKNHRSTHHLVDPVIHSFSHRSLQTQNKNNTQNKNHSTKKRTQDTKAKLPGTSTQPLKNVEQRVVIMPIKTNRDNVNDEDLNAALTLLKLWHASDQ
eukprot:338306_1